MTLLRVVIAVVLCVVVATQVTWSEVLITLRELNPLWAALGLAVVWAGLAVGVFRWQRILSGLGSPFQYGETTRVFGAGLFLNLFLPTSVGGDVYRLARVGSGGFGVRKSTLSLIVERGIGLLALMMLVSPAVLLHPQTSDLILVSILLGGGSIVLILALFFWGGALADLLSRRMSALEPLLNRGVRTTIRDLAPSTFLLSIVIHLTTITANYLFARALGFDLPWLDALALIPLIVLAGQIPISPGGIGVREAGYVYFLGRVGIEPEPALALGLTWLAALYLTGGIGAVLFLFDRKGTKAGPDTQSSATDRS